MVKEDKIYAIEGSLEIDFTNVPFDSKKDFEDCKKSIRVYARELIDKYNGAGVDLEFIDNTSGEYLD